MSGGSDRSFFEGKERQQLTIVTQLLRAIHTMETIDDVLQWLAQAIVQRFNVQLIQFWVLYINQMRQISVQLRAMSMQDPSVPERVVVNEQVMKAVELVSSEHPLLVPQLVEQVFPSFQASLMKRCGLNYCTYCLLDTNSALSALKKTRSYERTPQHPLITTILFLRQPPHQDLVPIITVILEQAIIMAESRGILAPPAPPPPKQPPLPEQRQEMLPPLVDLLPHRKEDPDLLMSSNPFASPIVIKDKQARRLYAAIDGHKSVAALCDATGMELEEIIAALQILLAQHRIELYEPGGRLVKASPFPKHH